MGAEKGTWGSCWGKSLGVRPSDLRGTSLGPLINTATTSGEGIQGYIWTAI